MGRTRHGTLSCHFLPKTHSRELHRNISPGQQTRRVSAAGCRSGQRGREARWASPSPAASRLPTGEAHSPGEELLFQPRHPPPLGFAPLKTGSDWIRARETSHPAAARPGSPTQPRWLRQCHGSPKDRAACPHVCSPLPLCPQSRGGQPLGAMWHRGGCSQALPSH
uniref:Uncharacterized protein n=1 Tax=Falco tinnunculus TaxID=100819 RepID=A0A8C4XUU2_FALTI